MAIKVGELYGLLEMRDKAFNDSMDKAHSSFASLGKVGKMTAGLIAGATSLVGAALTKVGFGYDALMEQSSIAWETLLGGANQAEKMINDLQKLGAKTPFEFEGLDKSAKLLKAMGFKGEEIIPTLRTVGDAVSAVGGNQDMLEGVSRAIGQMKTKGKVSAEEMMQLAEQGIPAWQLMADNMGMSTQELMNMSSQGKIMAKDAIPALLKGLGTDFGGAMKKQSTTWNGLISTIFDNMKMLSGEITKPLFDVAKKALPTVINMINGALAAVKKDGISGLFKGIVPDGLISNLGLVKGAIAGIFNIIMGKNDKGASLLMKLGLSPDTVLQIVGIFDTIKSVIALAIANIKIALSKVGPIITSMLPFFQSLLNIVIQVFSGIYSTIRSILNAVWPFIQQILTQIKTFWQQNGAQIAQAVTNAFNIIKAIISFVMPAVLFIIKMIWGNIKGVIQGALNVIMGAIKIFAGLFTGDWSKMWEGIKQLFVGAIQLIWNLINLMMFGRIIKGIATFTKLAVAGFKELWTNGVSIFKNLDNAVWGIIRGLTSKIISKITNMKNMVVYTFKSIRSTGASIFSSIGKTINSIVGYIYRTVTGKFSSMYSAVKGRFSNIYSSAKSTFGKIKNAITSPIESAKNTIRRLIDSIKGFFRNMKVKIPMPHFNFSAGHKKIAGVNIPYPKLNVDWYKNGGVFGSPGVVGVGDAGPGNPEVIAPEKMLKNVFANELAKHTGGVTVNNTFNAQELSPSQVARKEVQAWRRAAMGL